MESQLQNYMSEITSVKKTLSKKQAEYDDLNKSNEQFFNEQDQIQKTAKNFDGTIKKL